MTKDKKSDANEKEKKSTAQKKEKKLNVHEGHRERLRFSVDNDPELESFTEHQVLEYLLSFFIPRKDTNMIAHQLIDTFGNLYGVFSASPQELYAVSGMTANASHLIPNLTAIVRRAELSRVNLKTKISTTEDAVAIFKPYFMNRNQEKLYIACLDVNDKVMQITCIGEGLANFSQIDISKVMGLVTRTKATKIILAHNHPGGTLYPSKEDIGATSTLALTLNTVGTLVVDHIIFTSDGYYSFYQNDLMNEMFNDSDKVFGTQYFDRVCCRRDKKKYVLEAGEKFKDDDVLN